MRKLEIGVLDLVTKAPNPALYGRVMNANYAGIMPQVIAHWCEQLGHRVRFVCYTGVENLESELPKEVDFLFIAAFSQSAQLAYALSNLFQSRGALTVLGGPHARCYPGDACRFFDYVLGFTDREILANVLADRTPHRSSGLHLQAARQPLHLPGVRERWKFVEHALNKAPLFQLVPMIGSLGCPYTCDFCIDSEVPYQPLDFDVIREDLRFLRGKMRRPKVAWHDPNFGVRFDDYMSAIESAVEPGSIEFIAESSLSLLSEERLKRLKKNGFKVLLPGIESWYSHGNKSKTGIKTGAEKVRHAADHINLVLQYVPYVQANILLGLDVDEGAEPFELTKRFFDLTPGSFPGFSQFTAFGVATPLNRKLYQDGRLLPFPFHFMNNNHAMNVRPKNYSWDEFYEHTIALSEYVFSWRSIARRFVAARAALPRWMNVLRSISSEGFGRLRHYHEIKRRLQDDSQFHPFFEQQTTNVPQFYVDRIRKDLGPFWQWLPEGGYEHDLDSLFQSYIPQPTAETQMIENASTAKKP